MSRDHNTHEKRRRESEKKRKAEEKRVRRQRKKELATQRLPESDEVLVATATRPGGHIGHDAE